MIAFSAVVVVQNTWNGDVSAVVPDVYTNSGGSFMLMMTRDNTHVGGNNLSKAAAILSRTS